MHALVEELLDLGRLDSERLALNRRRLDVRDIVQQVVADHQWLLADAGLRCELALDRSPVLVLGDAEKLAQVFTNVIGNAIKFTPPPGSISISVGTKGAAWAEIGVRDTGVGLRPDELLKIFGRFHQASRGRHGGLGLGLPIAKGIADLHGGEIRAASDGPGKGCTITVRLPLTNSNESTDE